MNLLSRRDRETLAIMATESHPLRSKELDVFGVLRIFSPSLDDQRHDISGR